MTSEGYGHVYLTFMQQKLNSVLYVEGGFEFCSHTP